MRAKPVVPMLFGLILGIGASGLAMAGAFAVNPVGLTLSADRPIAAVTVHNQGEEAAVLQLEALAWRQSGGQDVYTSTTEVLATPPIFTLPAGGSQIVRVGLRRPADPSQELAYRLFFQEVPPPPKPGFQGLRVALRIGIPVFMLPASGVSAPELHWRISRNGAKALTVTASNSGNGHVKIMGFTLSSVDQRVLTTQALPLTVLAGQSHTWQMGVDRAPRDGRVHVMASTAEGAADGGILDIEAP